MPETFFGPQGPSLPGTATSSTGSRHSGDQASADVVAKVAEKVQDDLRQWLDRELEGRVHHVVDERIVAERERRAWRRGSEVF